LGGKATSEQVRAAIAWGSLPTIVSLVVWVPQLILFDQELFTQATPRLEAHPLLAAILLGFGLIQVALGIWSLVLVVKCLAEAHQFSAWRALAALFLGSLVVAAPFLCLALVLIGVGGLAGLR
jgi:hypothetical protein